MIAYGHWLATQSLAICSSDSHPLQHASASSSASLISNQSSWAGWNFGVWLNFGGRGAEFSINLLLCLMLLPPLTKQQPASKFEEDCACECVCVCVCEASPKYESHIYLPESPPLMAWEGEKNPSINCFNNLFSGGRSNKSVLTPPVNNEVFHLGRFLANYGF